MNSVTRLNANTPFLQGIPNSYISKEWYLLLFSISEILGGGASVVPLDVFQNTLETQRRPVETAASYSDIIQRLSLLESFISRTLGSFRNRLERKDDDIEAMMVVRRSPAIGTLTNANFVDGEVPTGTIDGVNVTFTLAGLPVSGSVHLYLNGLRQRPTTDFSVAGNVITYTAGAKPSTGDNHVADYRK